MRRMVLALNLFLALSVGLLGTDSALAADVFEKGLDSLKEDLETMPSPPAAPVSQAAGASSSVSAAGQPRPSAAEPPNQVVKIEVRGNQIISRDTVLSKLKIQPGHRLAQDTINEDIKRLYGTGFFDDIRMEVEEVSGGYILVITVREKPIVRQIDIRGFSIFKEDKIRKELKIIEGQILDRKAVKEGVEAIKKLYASKGYRFVGVDSSVDVNEKTKEAVVRVQIAEGAKYKISDIQFDGVQAFKPAKLQKLMKTKKENRWLLRSGVFKEDVFEKDLEKIRFYYLQEGYLDVKVEPEFEYEDAAQKIKMNIRVDEGQHYVTGEIKIRGNQLFPEAEIWQQLEMLPGLTYSQYYLSQDMERIREYYEDRGYIDVRIIPDIRLNRDSGKVDVVYDLEEGDLYFVEKVMVRGNTKTKDIVIRRELRIRPGERFDGEKIRKSKQRLNNLGFFEDVTYDTEPTPSGPNRKDLIFRVKEKRTGELSFGGGVSSIDNFIGFAEISQRNFDLLNFPRFTGAGQSLSLRARLGSYTKDFNLSFVEPYLFNRPVSFGTDLYHVRRDNRNTDFDEDRTGAGVTFSRLFRDVLRVGTGYTFEQVTLRDLSDDAPQIVRDFDGDNLLSRLKLFTSHDTRDNVFNPMKGHLLGLNGELIGTFLGGDHNYYILQSSYTQYWNFRKKHLLEFRVRLGTAQGVGSTEDVPVFDRFYAGGLGTVRGFNYRRVGPIEAGDAVGGETLAVANLEYSFELPKLEGFRPAVFVDAGQVNSESYKIGFGDFSVSIGPGIRIKTPIGPIALYYGFPIANRDTEDRNGRLEFSLSRGF